MLRIGPVDTKQVLLYQLATLLAHDDFILVLVGCFYAGLYVILSLGVFFLSDS